jgi:uncharacterized membrane protein (UPF0127 family)
MKRMTGMALIGFAAGFALIGYGLYAKYFYHHPADYTEATVTVTPQASGTEPSATVSATSSKPAPIQNGTTVSIDGAIFDVDVADTVPKQVQGLSGRSPLKSNEGMLFLFSFARNEGFWMYDMKFPLDIVWINGNRIVGVSADVPAPKPGQASSTLPIYYPPSPIDKVLEVNAGTAAKYGFKAGDTISISRK